MLILRKLTVGLFGFLLGIALLIGVGAFVFNNTLGNSNSLKQNLAQGGLYDNFIPVIVEQLQNPSEGEEQGAINSLDKQVLTDVLNKSLPPSYLQQKTELVIDGTYRWLNGLVPVPDFVIDLSDRKEVLATNLGELAIQRWNQLPKCTPSQSKTILSGEIDPFTVECQVIGVTTAHLQAKISESINNIELLNKPITSTNQDGKPTIFETDLKEAPATYMTLQKTPLVIGVFTIIASLIVIFASVGHRSGLRKTSNIFFSSGIFLIINGLIVKYGLSNLVKRLSDDGQEPSKSIQELILPLVSVFGAQMGSIYLWCGFVIVLVGTTIYIYLRQTNQSTTDKSPDNNTETPSSS